MDYQKGKRMDHSQLLPALKCQLWLHMVIRLWKSLSKHLLGRGIRRTTSPFNLPSFHSARPSSTQPYMCYSKCFNNHPLCHLHGVESRIWEEGSQREVSLLLLLPAAHMFRMSSTIVWVRLGRWDLLPCLFMSKVQRLLSRMQDPFCNHVLCNLWDQSGSSGVVDVPLPCK